MRTNLKVPFAEKDEAKKLGARWDAARKIWFVEGKDDMAPFAKWAPTPQTASASKVPGSAASAAQSAGKVIVGSDYRELARVCECLPWAVCEKCQSTALGN